MKRAKVMRKRKVVEERTQDMEGEIERLPSQVDVGRAGSCFLEITVV